MKEQRIFIQGLDCPDCVKILEDDLRGVTGVEKVELEFMRGSLHITGNFDTQFVQERIQSLGYSVLDADPNLPVKQGENNFSAFWEYLFRRFEFKLALLGVVLLLLSFLLVNFNAPDWSILIIRLSALSLAGYPVFRSGLKSLFVNRFFNINFLMMVAAVGAVVIGELLEAAIMLILFTVSEALEGYTNDRARAVLSGFTTLAPRTALRITPQGEENAPVESLNIGDVILVRSGERFPMDGEVVDGFSDVDQALITGESRLIAKKPGDKVLSGTINGQGVLKVRVTRKAVDSTIQRIIKLVTEAQSAKAESQKSIDKFAKYYTPAVVILAVLIALLPTLLFNMPFWNTPDVRGWLHRALSLLVIGCPCALVISTPVTIISSLIAAAKSGVIFKGGIFIEGLSQVKAFAFDKTGTLTRGKPELVQLHAMDCSGAEDCEACDDLLALACALDERSSHPLRNAGLEAGALRQVSSRYRAAEGLVTLGGKGLQGKVDGRLATIGSLAL
ncbi:MAG: heavy metal translocating P-type ATPase, partial [Chloroflexota bacterium]